ncbi:AAA family ATPase [Streptomyces sp. NPDC057654]|uniref:MoxR family ATPase n=1 Tax=Streptomyces sp. NPDC057654 TaxID=3346196 RepID=UPI0036BF9639
MNDWLIYRGTGEPHRRIDELPAPPPWRDFDGGPELEPADAADSSSNRRLGPVGEAELFRPEGEELELINAALYLRRPLLVTGDPGTGKSTLAHAVARELGLGRVLRWPIVSRTTLTEGLYQYDAIARLQDVQLGGGPDHAVDAAAPRGIGGYIRLGPLGTAMLPFGKPRVLLVDELDKSDIDLPNDLLNILEEGEFPIPELERIADREPEVDVLTDDGRRVRITGGRVSCRAFPFVVLTSNGERDFPAALMRRCIHLPLGRPDKHRLAAMVRAHFGESGVATGQELINEFLTRSATELVAADQLLNAIYLSSYATKSTEDLAKTLMRRLDRSR